MSIRKFIIVNIVVTCIIIFCASTVMAQIDFGKNCLQMAYDFKNLEKFDKSLEYCDKAIAALQKAKKSVIAKNLLSEAHYLKAHILMYMQIEEKEIEGELVKALVANPDYEPPEGLASNPAVVMLLIKAKGRYEEEIEQSYDKALNYFALEKYCLAMEILEPIAIKCRNSETALNILKRCQLKCTGASKTVAAVTAQKEPEAEKLPATPHIETPVPPRGDIKRIGVFPVIFVDSRKDSYSKKIKAMVTQKSICEELKKQDLKIDFDIIDDAEVGKFKSDYKIDNFDSFVVDFGKMYVEKITVKSVLDGIKPEVVMGKLFTINASKLKKMCQSKGIDYALFVKVKIPLQSNVESGIVVAMNLYSMENPQKPAVNEKWDKINDPKYVKTKIPRMAKYFKRYMQKQIGL